MIYLIHVIQKVLQYSFFHESINNMFLQGTVALIYHNAYIHTFGLWM